MSQLYWHLWWTLACYPGIASLPDPSPPWSSLGMLADGPELRPSPVTFFPLKSGPSGHDWSPPLGYTVPPPCLTGPSAGRSSSQFPEDFHNRVPAQLPLLPSLDTFYLLRDVDLEAVPFKLCTLTSTSISPGNLACDNIWNPKPKKKKTWFFTETTQLFQMNFSCLLFSSIKTTTKNYLQPFPILIMNM